MLVLEGRIFEIDNEGTIWRTGLLYQGKVRPTRKRRGEQLLSPDGYMRFTIRTNGEVLRVMAHRLVWTKLHGRIPDGKEINHKDGNKTNNAPTNLECVTPKENVKHSIQVLGVCRARGEANGASKFTAKEIIEMRSLWPRMSYATIGEKFGANKWTVREIIKRKRWKHI